MKRLAQKFTPGWLAIAGVIVPATVGCRPDFAPYNRVTDLRVLAIQSEPASPAPGETATLSALVYTPPADSNLRYSWDWCPFPGAQENGYPCFVTEEQAMMAGAAPFHLSDGPTAMLPHSVPSELLAAFCAGAPGFPEAPNCDEGFPAQVRLTVTTDSADGNQTTVVAVVTHHWRFMLPNGDLQAANANPVVGDLTATLAGTAGPVVIGEAGDVTLPRDTVTPVNAVIDLSASETYDGPDDNGNQATLQERLFATWFVESGDTDDTRTSYRSGATPFEALGANKWSPGTEKDYAPDTAQIFVILHDNRGGVGWRGGKVTLGPKL